MPATVSTIDIHLQLERSVRAGVEGFFEKYPENWGVSIAGAQGNAVWVLKVVAPDSQREWVRRLEDGEHDIGNILKVLGEIAAELSLTQT